MDREYKRWILTKVTYFTPTGTLQVGQILTDPFDPETGLHRTISSRMPDPSSPTFAEDFDLDAEITELTDLEISQSSELSRHFGLWADLNLASVSGGPGLNTSADKASSATHLLTWKFDTIQTTIITPSDGYVEAALQRGDVPKKLAQIMPPAKKPRKRAKSWLPFISGGDDETRTKKPQLYIVTGTRVVKGARMVRKDAQASNSGFSASASTGGAAGAAATGGVVPLSAGAGISGGRASSGTEEVSFGSATDFVFAYRLSEIFYAVNTTTTGKADFEHTPYAKGETASVDSGGKRQAEGVSADDGDMGKEEEEEDDELEAIAGIEFIRVDEEDFGGEDDGNLLDAAGFVERPLEGVDGVLYLIPV